MDYLILKHYAQVSDYVGQVTSIADKHKEAFGFLSASAYEQMASKGQLWIAVNSDRELKGYLIFGGTMPTLKVFQVFSCDSVRGRGVARMLIDALKEHARKGHYHTISARVASDLPANLFWENLGFAIYRQVKGGETKKRIINIRGYSLEDNDLFGGMGSERGPLTPSGPMLDRPIYAIDINLLLDVYKARQGYEKVVKIMRIGFQGGFSICVTPEFKRELERQSKYFKDDPVLRLAGFFPELKASDDINNISKSLREIVFPCRNQSRKSMQNDESDLRHLAHCVSAKIDGFITREKAMLRACDQIKDRYGVSIISPEELILDEGDQLDISSPMNSDFSFDLSSANSEIKDFLEGYSAPDEIIDRIFTPFPVKDDNFVYEARLEGNLFGVYFFQKPVKSIGAAVACLYVDENCSKSVAAIDHFLEKALRYRSGFLYRLDLYVGKDQALTEDTLLKKGFLKSKECFIKIICNVFLDNKNWPRFAKDVKSVCGLSMPEKLPSKKELSHTGVCISDPEKKVNVLPWFDFETIISPRFILSPDRSCVLVPIRENYASGLIGNVTKQRSFLPSHEKSLLLEKAYFRSPRKASLFSRGGVIAFYVSGKESIQEIIGFARITYTEVVGIDEAVLKVDRQGVLSRSELAEQSDDLGRLHVFTFDNFLEFDRRVSFRKAKGLGLISNANLVSPEKIGFDKLKMLIGEAFYE